ALDVADQLAGQPFQAQVLSYLGVQAHVRGAVAERLHVQLVTDYGRDLVFEWLARQRQLVERLANFDTRGVAGGETGFDRPARARHLMLQRVVQLGAGLREVGQVHAALAGQVAIDRLRDEGRERRQQLRERHQRTVQRLVGGELVGVRLRLPEAPPGAAHVPRGEVFDE